MSFTKADGAKIKITFDQPITAGAAGNQSHFTVTVPEYTFVPGGTLQNVIKAVASTAGYTSIQQTVDLSDGVFAGVTTESNCASLSKIDNTSSLFAYYNGTKLPKIPQALLGTYTSFWIRKDTKPYSLIASSYQWYVSSSAAYISTPSKYDWYTLSTDGATWAYYATYTDNGNFSLSSASVLWANLDMLNGSATATDVYLAGSQPTTDGNYDNSGNAIYSISGLSSTAKASSISWSEDTPTGTSAAVSVSTDGTNYRAVTNGGALLAAGTVLDNATLYIRVELTTTDTTVTPTVSDLALSIQSDEDANSIVLEMEPLQRFESAAGDITVAYDGSGTLQGAGGPVSAFTQSFTPADLIPKPDQNDQEHIAITSVTANGTLTAIQYVSAKAEEHISITGITAVGVLTNINDI